MIEVVAAIVAVVGADRSVVVVVEVCSSYKVFPEKNNKRGRKKQLQPNSDYNHRSETASGSALNILSSLTITFPSCSCHPSRDNFGNPDLRLRRKGSANYRSFPLQALTNRVCGIEGNRR